ncbi:MAG: isocitrate lyase/phosphoenolpyruvate mutase family protein [Solirubrobacteraceae bacterium]
MSIDEQATALLELHTAPEPLVVVNVWDAITAKVVADLDGTKAIATASHSIAASLGYGDGEQIPRDLMIEMVGRITTAADGIPVSADLEAGYGDIEGTIRAAIAAGASGANLEDQMRPFDEAVANVATALRVAREEGVPDFVLNARTDAFVKADACDGAECMAVAIQRGQAFLEAGAPCVFVPGKFDHDQIAQLVEAFGPQKLSVIGLPGTPALAELRDLGVARVSYGPWTQRVALNAVTDLATSLYDGGTIPDDTPVLT